MMMSITGLVGVLAAQAIPVIPPLRDQYLTLNVGGDPNSPNVVVEKTTIFLGKTAPGKPTCTTSSPSFSTVEKACVYLSYGNMTAGTEYGVLAIDASTRSVFASAVQAGEGVGFVLDGSAATASVFAPQSMKWMRVDASQASQSPAQGFAQYFCNWINPRPCSWDSVSAFWAAFEYAGTDVVNSIVSDTFTQSYEYIEPNIVMRSLLSFNRTVRLSFARSTGRMTKLNHTEHWEYGTTHSIDIVNQSTYHDAAPASCFTAPTDGSEAPLDSVCPRPPINTTGHDGSGGGGGHDGSGGGGGHDGSGGGGGSNDCATGTGCATGLGVGLGLGVPLLAGVAYAASRRGQYGYGRTRAMLSGNAASFNDDRGQGHSSFSAATLPSDNEDFHPGSLRASHNAL